MHLPIITLAYLVLFYILFYFTLFIITRLLFVRPFRIQAGWGDWIDLRERERQQMLHRGDWGRKKEIRETNASL